ncbi:MAG: hypothetical protein HY053_02460 [Proteobacteria bacterium]|nr:hypothetical protein [Pseudomonadota bacterium]
MAMGIPGERIQSLVGKADREPLVTNDPANPQNRRISIMLLRRSYTEQMMGTPPPAPQTQTPP